MRLYEILSAPTTLPKMNVFREKGAKRHNFLSDGRGWDMAPTIVIFTSATKQQTKRAIRRRLTSAIP